MPLCLSLLVVALIDVGVVLGFESPMTTPDLASQSLARMDAWGRLRLSSPGDNIAADWEERFVQLSRQARRADGDAQRRQAMLEWARHVEQAPYGRIRDVICRRLVRVHANDPFINDESATLRWRDLPNPDLLKRQAALDRNPPDRRLLARSALRLELEQLPVCIYPFILFELDQPFADWVGVPIDELKALQENWAKLANTDGQLPAVASALDRYHEVGTPEEKQRQLNEIADLLDHWGSRLHGRPPWHAIVFCSTAATWMAWCREQGLHSHGQARELVQRWVDQSERGSVLRGWLEQLRDYQGPPRRSRWTGAPAEPR